jgi:hypothetical protein
MDAAGDQNGGPSCVEDFAKEPAMSTRSFCLLAAAVFGLVALLQLVRAILGWPITIDGYTVPVMASWIAAVVAAALAWLGYKAAPAA